MGLQFVSIRPYHNGRVFFFAFFYRIFDKNKLMEKDKEQTPEKKGKSMLEMLQEAQYDNEAPSNPPPEEPDDNDEENIFGGDPFSGFSFGDEGQPIGEAQSPPPPNEAQRPDPNKLNEANAKMAVNILDLACCKIAAAISGKDSQGYKLDEGDKSDYITITADYFATMQTSVSPALMWWATTITLVGATIYRASEDKRAVAQAAIYKKNKEHYQRLQRDMTATSEDLAQSYQQVQETKPKGPQRQRFEVGSDFLYSYSENGTYLKKKDRKHSPTAAVRQIIEEGQEMKLSPGEINRLCKEFLYGESN